MADLIPMTRAGYDKLKAELEHMESGGDARHPGSALPPRAARAT